MIWSFIQSGWHFVFGWAGIDILAGLAAVLVAVFEPPIVAVLIPDLRKWAIAAAVVAFTLTGAIAYGYSNGLQEKQAQWDAALAREAQAGEAARTDAERTVRVAPPDRVRNDPRNRDNWKHASEPPSKVRRLAGYQFFLRAGQRSNGSGNSNP